MRKKINAFCIGTPEGFIPPECNDFNKLSVEWYMNHSCNGNVGFDKKGDFIAIKDVMKDTELCYDYALIESNPKFKMKCNCESSNCRGIITGQDWKNEIIWKKNYKYMHPVLRENANEIFASKSSGI